MKQSRETIQKRQQDILDLINEKKEVSITEISDFCKMSTLTVRRDLEELRKKRLIERFSGGARIIEGENFHLSFVEKEHEANREKRLIANYCANLIHEDSTIFVNSGTTVLELIRLLKDKHVTIITNNALAFTNVENSKCEMLCTGGLYNDKTRSFTGAYATTIIQNTLVDMCILGANGISSAFGITTASSGEPVVNQLMVQRCKGQRIIVASGKKFGKMYCFNSVSLDQIDMIITDSTADPEEVKRIRDYGVEIVIVDEEN